MSIFFFFVTSPRFSFFFSCRFFPVFFFAVRTFMLITMARFSNDLLGGGARSWLQTCGAFCWDQNLRNAARSQKNVYGRHFGYLLFPFFFSFRKLPNLLNCQFVKRCMMFSLCIVLVIASLYGTASLDKNSSKFHSIANR